MKKLLGIITTVALVCTVQAQTTFTAAVDDALDNAANWSAGLPSNNVGTVAIDATLGTGNINASTWGTFTLNHTAGTLSGTGNHNFHSNTNGLVHQSGGSVVVGNSVWANRVDYLLSGGTISAALIKATNGAEFRQTGGTVSIGQYNLLKADSIISLTGGSATLTDTGEAFLFNNDATDTITIGGGFSADITAAANLIAVGTSSGSVKFDADWTGSLTKSGTSTIDWKADLTNGYVSVGGTTVTAGNFASLFVVSGDGNTLTLSEEEYLINSFTATPAEIQEGGSATLSWNVSGAATLIEIDQGIGAVSATNSTVVSPTETTTYTLTASNATSLSIAEVTVEVTATNTIFNVVGGNLGTATNWTDGLPDNNVGTVAIDAVSGNISAATWGTFTLNHTAGTISGANHNIYGNTSGVVHQSGGSVAISGTLFANKVSYLLSGGTVSAGTVRASNSAEFSQTGGTVSASQYRLTTAGVMSLTGGSATLNDADEAFFFDDNATETLTIGGDFSADITAAANLIAIGASAGSVNFATNWAGSLTKSGTSTIDWEADLTNGYVSVDGTVVTAGNFASLLSVSSDGNTLTLKAEEPIAVTIEMSGPIAGDMQLVWANQPGKTYTVETNDNLTVDNWGAWASGITSAETTITNLVPIGPDQLFIRVETSD